MSATVAEKTTREIASSITRKVAVGCWQFQSEGWLIEMIDKALRDRDERVAGIIESEIRAAAEQLTERGDEGRDILNYTDFIKGQKTAAQDILSAIRGSQ
jgi:hypothetical protein